jgi:hypothetical protein
VEQRRTGLGTLIALAVHDLLPPNASTARRLRIDQFGERG